MIPFGARVTFFPPKTTRHFKDKLKFGPKHIGGIFLGYHLKVGYTWNGRYHVAAFDDFDHLSLLKGNVTSYHEVPVLSVSRVWATLLGKYWECPLRERWENANSTMSGKVQAEMWE